MTSDPFKTRWLNHNSDFKYENRKHSTKLSSFIWKCKEENIETQISYKILKKSTPFSPVTGVCQLCIDEKFEIIFNPMENKLNSRQELLSTCRHIKKQLLIKPIRKKKKTGGG